MVVRTRRRRWFGTGGSSRSGWRSRRRPWRTHRSGPARDRTGGFGIFSALATIVVLVIVAAILLVVTGANRGNDVVGAVVTAGDWLTTPFQNAMPQDDPQRHVIVNWGLAAGVYLLIGMIFGRLVRI